ncbi:MAG: site-specific integrase [Oscillospiraceae bacterium]|nr:site-specific integrase [Oscillospiraceae bacterium]
MPRRANGEGSVRQLKNGSWEARIMCGFRPDGKPRIKTFTAGKRSVVARRLADFIAGEKKARQTCRLPLGEWLETWLDEYVARRLRTSTRTSYENIIRNQILPRLGATRLHELRREEVEAFYAALLEGGRADGRGGLSRKTVRNVHIVLHRALEAAAERELIGKNPAAAAAMPGRRGAPETRSAEVLTLEEQRALTARCGPDACGTAVVTALSTGLRMGELLGLRWADIDFAARTVSVRRQLARLRDYSPQAGTRTRLRLEEGAKTEAGLRVIPVDESLCGRLLAWRARQAAEAAEAAGAEAGYAPERRRGRRAGPDLHAPEDMVFTAPGRAFLDPATFRYHYRLMLKAAGARPLSIHALRHTFATRALEAGVPVRAVSSLLGHAASQITMDIYSHVLPAFQAEAVSRIAGYIAGETTAP